MKETTRGKLILVEGISGSGKSTLAKEWIVPFLESQGKKVLLDSEPTQGVIGKGIRKLIEGKRFGKAQLSRFSTFLEVLVVTTGAFVKMPKWQDRLVQKYASTLAMIPKKIQVGEPLTELDRQLLFLADRQYDLDDTIIPALLRGEWVVLDRYDLSNFAYGAAHGLEMYDLYKWHKAVLQEKYLVPDATIFVDVSPEIATERLASSGKTIDRYEKLESLCKVAAAYERALHLRIQRDRALVLRIDGEQRASEVCALAVRALRMSGLAK